ncbi:MAG: hypothetical protein WAM39_12600 [Bryobacteraceae bacterium]
MRLLFLVLLLREVLVFKTPPVVPNVPPTRLILKYFDFLRLRERLFIECVCDYFTQPVTDAPIFQDFLDIEVKIPSRSYRH